MEACQEVYDAIVEDTPFDTGNCQSLWSDDIGPDDAYFDNSCEYASFLEDGHSDQAPDGMVQINLDKLDDIIDSLMSEDTADQLDEESNY
jgi:hypothetical protein